MLQFQTLNLFIMDTIKLEKVKVKTFVSCKILLVEIVL
jgi:hypothetical protein